MKNKREKIKSLVYDMLQESHIAMVNKIDSVLDSGAIDIEGWNEYDKPMILPKCIVTAILQNESHAYEGKGTSYEKMIKHQVKNIKYFI